MENISRHHGEQEKPDLTEHTNELYLYEVQEQANHRFLVPGQDGVNVLVPPPSAKSS